MPILDKNHNIPLIINALFSTTTKASKIAIIPIDKENIKKCPNHHLYWRLRNLQKLRITLPFGKHLYDNKMHSKIPPLCHASLCKYVLFELNITLHSQSCAYWSRFACYIETTRYSTDFYATIHKSASLKVCTMIAVGIINTNLHNWYTNLHNWTHWFSALTTTEPLTNPTTVSTSPAFGSNAKRSKSPIFRNLRQIGLSVSCYGAIFR